MTGSRADWETLVWLDWQRLLFRSGRFADRLRNPRRLCATIFAGVFVTTYLLVGVTVLSQRAAAAPEHVQRWLTGGMILYSIYHTIKLIWTDREKLHRSSAASDLWLQGAPISGDSLLLRQLLQCVPSCATKSILLLVILSYDVPSVIALALGVFLALLTLEWFRRFVEEWVLSLRPIELNVARGLTILAGLSIASHLLISVWFNADISRDPVVWVTTMIAALADYTMTGPIQAMGIPLMPAAKLATSTPLFMLPNAMVALMVLLTLYKLLITARIVCRQRRRGWERECLESLVSGKNTPPTRGSVEKRRRRGLQFSCLQSPFGAMLLRQWSCVWRYRLNILLSFLIPTLLSLSPLATDQGIRAWVFVIGGIAVCSLLLAPPALQIDFRRDLRRMVALRALPSGPWETCLGMICLPVAITVLFQWFTLFCGAALSEVTMAHVIWLAIALPSLAVITFAAENALFLMFPHHRNDQGIGMVIRAKVTFLWKGMLLAFAPVGLVIGMAVCQRTLPVGFAEPIAYTGSLIVAWSAAMICVYGLTRCWQRFDALTDIPPE